MHTDRFIDLLLTGQYLPAIGLALIAFVAAARAGLVVLSPWFATKPGGYVIGFGSAALLFLAASLEAGQAPTPGIVAGALGAGWAASGGFEMIRDLLEYLRRKTPRPPAVALVLLVTMLACGTFACGTKPYLPPVTYPIIDCVNADRPAITSLIASFWPTDAGKPDWGKIKSDAIAAGVSVGGCAIAQFVQNFLAPSPGFAAPPPEAAISARETLETFRREQAGGATFRTSAGDI